MDGAKQPHKKGRQAPSMVVKAGGRARLAKALRLFTHSGSGPVDTVLAAAVVALVGFGIVMVYSASAFEATVRFNDAQYFLKRQAIYGGAALVTLWLASRFDYKSIRKLTYPVLIL